MEAWEVAQRDVDRIQHRKADSRASILNLCSNCFGKRKKERKKGRKEKVRKKERKKERKEKKRQKKLCFLSNTELFSKWSAERMPE